MMINIIEVLLIASFPGRILERNIKMTLITSMGILVPIH